MQPDKNRLEAIPADTEPGMNLISVDFDLVMVNRPNERLYGKPMVALLGKKCYREFEKRDEPCPHCPGRVALATGEAHETETVGLRDNGTRFFARIRAHPVAGPNGQPTGFIEVVEDITEEKRAEALAAIYSELRAALPTTHSVRKALRETFEAAMQVEGIDIGCIFLVDQATGEYDLMYQRNVPSECLPLLMRMSAGEPLAILEGVTEAPKAVEVVPVLHRGNAVAILAVGSSAYPDIPSTLRAGLQSLGAAAGNAISRVRAEQSRGDAVADLEALVAVNPVPTWVLDMNNRVTSWNKAAEELFGWKNWEIVGRPSPFDLPDRERDSGLPESGAPRTTLLPRKDGSPVDVRLVTAPFRDVVGDSSTVIVMAEDLTLKKRVAEVERRLAAHVDSSSRREASDELTSSPDPPPRPTRRVLLIDSDGDWSRELVAILTELGYSPMACSSVGEAAALLTRTKAEEDPFALAVVDLVSPAHAGGPAQAAVLRGLGLEAPVVVSSEADVRGYEQHGIAGVIKRPYVAEAVAQVVKGVLKTAD